MIESLAVLWTSAREFGFPHSDKLAKYNPELPQYFDIGQDSDDSIGWRNNDRQPRNWWKANRGCMEASHMLVLDWDVMWATTVGDLTPGDVLFHDVIPNRTEWHWWSEVDSLPDEFKPHATGATPLGVALYSRRFLDAIIDTALDPLYVADIFCELRTPTAARYLGFEPKPLLSPPGRIECYPIDVAPDAHGVFHAVKRAVEYSPLRVPTVLTYQPD